jgi:DNA processing protein
MSQTIDDRFFYHSPLSPKQEVLCYESLWAESTGVTFKVLEESLQRKLPSSLYSRIPQKTKETVQEYLNKIESYKYDVLIRETIDYPRKLSLLEIPLLYYSGDIGLIESPCISIVGARKASPRGIKAAQMIAKGLSEFGYTIVSGLAAGIDTAAHTSAIEAGGKTIGVIGTPLNQAYPKENINLQEKIGVEHLLLSHVPFFKYAQQNYKINRGFFPERNKVMAALSEATIIAEASDTSGSLIQARECFRLNKKLIILKPTYDDKSLTWPRTYVSRGAVVAETLADIKKILNPA